MDSLIDAVMAAGAAGAAGAGAASAAGAAGAARSAGAASGEAAGTGVGQRRETEGPDRARPLREPLWRDVVGEVLRQERRSQQRTLKDVADEARISMPYLSELERGRKEASSEVLAAAAKALGLRLSELVSLAQVRLGGYERTRAAQAGSGVSRRDMLCLAA